jgi:hypothetical protein
MTKVVQPAAALARVRATCLALPDTTERLSHGAPTFFVEGKRAFVIFHDDHHGDGRLAIWCAAPMASNRRWLMPILRPTSFHHMSASAAGLERGWI